METSPRERRGPGGGTLIFLMIIAFMNTLGFGLVIPALPFIVRQYASSPDQLAMSMAWLGSAYALCQFLAAPVLGALSDRFGRRPLLLLCLLGSAAGYALFGMGGALWVIFLGRIIDGLTGGNFSILAAYIADVAKPQERSRYFGMLGAASGAGFMVGPAAGGFLASLGYSVPAYAAAAVALASLAWGLLAMPESLPRERRRTSFAAAELNPFKQLGAALALPQLRWLFAATFCFALAFAMMQSNISVLLIDHLRWNADMIGAMFLVIGIFDIVMQGGIAGWLLPRLGEERMSVVGLVCEAAGYALMGAIAIIPSPLLMLGAITLYAIGTGFREPATRGLISQVADEQQGMVQGGSQAIQSLATVVGPLIAGLLYAQVGHAVPYWVGAAVALLAAAAVVRSIPVLHAHRTTLPAEALG